MDDEITDALKVTPRLMDSRRALLSFREIFQICRYAANGFEVSRAEIEIRKFADESVQMLDLTGAIAEPLPGEEVS